MNAPDNIQSASVLLLIRPSHFGPNAETAASNIFQKDYSASDAETGRNISRAAKSEFDHFVSLLQSKEIETLVLDDTGEATPDSIFPNNWFSTHHEGTVLLYPMLSPSRRLEKRKDIFEHLLPERKFTIRRIVDLTHFENQQMFLEGTGSLVFDHANKLAYANLSARTNRDLVKRVCSELAYEPVIFKAKTKDGSEIYHTNVLLTIAEKFAAICIESIPNREEREKVQRSLRSSGRSLIPISFEQMEKFAGNMLEVRNKKGERITVLSQSAFDCLDNRQRDQMMSLSGILPVPVPTIEEVGGGSVRCMMAEIFLPVAGQ